MLVEVFDAIAPARTLLFQRDEQWLAAIVDGAGSWGTGREAASAAALAALAAPGSYPSPVIFVRS